MTEADPKKTDLLDRPLPKERPGPKPSPYAKRIQIKLTVNVFEAQVIEELARHNDCNSRQEALRLAFLDLARRQNNRAYKSHWAPPRKAHRRKRH